MKALSYKNLPILVIGGLALVLRLWGIRYALPLWIVGDEPTLIFGALKMLELKTLIPSLHTAAFGSTFYYAPFLPYVFLAPIAAVIGWRWIFLDVSTPVFQNMLAADVSSFFLVGRICVALMGTAAVYFLYRAVQNIFHNNRAALVTAAIFAVSYMPVNLSHWARHWTPILLFLCLVLFFLSEYRWSIERRYVATIVCVALATGVSVQGALVALVAVFWFLCFDSESFRQLLLSKKIWQGVTVSVGIIIIEFLLWPRSFAFVYDAPGQQPGIHHTAFGLLNSFVFHFDNLWRAEPVLLLCAIGGSVYLAHVNKKFLLASLLFQGSYITIMYLFVGNLDRYVALVYPFLAIFAGVGLDGLGHKLFANKYASTIFVAVPCCAMLLVSARFDYLLAKNDTRIEARQWIFSNLPSETKILVVAPETRMPSTAPAILELTTIDPSAARSVDRAEAALASDVRETKYYHALNAYTITTSTFFANIGEYATSHGYQYALIDDNFLQRMGGPANVSFGRVVATFVGVNNPIDSAGHQDIPDGFGGGIEELFASASLGPTIKIYQLKI